MLSVSERLASLAPSATLAMSQKSNELKAQGIDVINLSVGEPDFNTPDHIKAAAKKAIDDNFSFYSPVPGYPALRKAICEKLKTENGLDYTPEQIVCSNGAKQSVCNVILAVIGKGDEVIIPAPYWVSYPEMVKIADGTNVIVSAGIEQDFKITPQQLEEVITPKTKAIILCSPSNPTGSVYSKDELKGLADVLAKYPDIIIISDEIYEHINYGGAHESIAQFENVRDRVVIVNGVSKGYAMTGWRLGYALAPARIMEYMLKIHQFAIMSAPTISQYAAVSALRDGDKDIEMMKESYDQRRRFLMETFREMGLPCFEPYGAFYVFPDISEFGMNSEEFCTALLKAENVAVVPGSAFGECGDRHVRISYAYSVDTLKEAMKRLSRFVQELRGKHRS